MAEYFRIDLPDKHKDIIQNIKIEKNFDPFSHFHNPSWKSFEGNSKGTLYEYIYKSIINVSAKNKPKLARDAAKIINKILELAIVKLSKNMNIKNFNKLVWLRYRTESNEFDEPRWHSDFYYTINDNFNTYTNQKKIIISLIGPGTLILKCDNDMNEEINKKLIELQGKYREPSLENFRNINNEISENLKSCEIKQLENFEGVIYNIGGEADSCIHSEPKFNKPRLFLGLVLNEI